MKYIKSHPIKVTEAIKTDCQTPDAIYDISINNNSISCNVELPFDLDLSEEQATELESNLHNVIEIALSKYFNK